MSQAPGTAGSDADDRGMPSIESWWPHLTAAARHLVLERPAAELPPAVREEIEAITGRRVEADARLSRSDRGYVAVQQEPVD